VKARAESEKIPEVTNQMKLNEFELEDLRRQIDDLDRALVNPEEILFHAREDAVR
jgi:hypothetical protein